MKIKTNIKKISSVLLFILFWLCVLTLLRLLLVPKYQSGVVEGSMIAEYYDDAGDHDVIMLGDCEVYENISTIELWKRYGITSYIRGSAQQLTWQSYYLLEDTLRYETPKAVVFNVLALKYNEPKSEAYNRMTLDGMRWSETKVRAVKASMTDEEKFADYLFPLLRYHARWSELTDDDLDYLFSKDKVTHNGYYMRTDVRPQEEFPDPMPLTDYALGENAMGYLQKMADLCKQKGITLVLIKAPTEFPHWYDEWDEQTADFARKNGLSYLNFIPLKDEIGLDMSADTYDAGLHLNLSGAEKMADYFGGWLAENCGLEDHRGDERLCDIWQKKIDSYENEKQKQLREIEENGELISFIPAETKETNILKNLFILTLLAAVSLALVGCGADTDNSGGNTNSGSVGNTAGAPAEEEAPAADNKEQSAEPEQPEGFYFALNGTDIAIDAPMAEIADKLGEPTKYFESESCAFQGLDKVYTYGSAVIRTYPLDNVDYVLSVELNDDTVSTCEGVSIGDSRARVTEIYGEPASESDASASYTSGGCTLSFFFGDDGVTSITYTQATGS